MRRRVKAHKAPSHATATPGAIAPAKYSLILHGSYARALQKGPDLGAKGQGPFAQKDLA